MATPVSTQVMLYMSAQNELSGKSDENLADIVKCVNLDDMGLFVIQDKIQGSDIRVTNVYRVPVSATADGFEASKQEYADKDITNPDVFQRHVGWARDHFNKQSGTAEPRQKILILWGHGAGLVMLDQQVGAGVQQTQADVKNFARVLTKTAERAVPFEFDIVAFDTCYMAMIETMHELRFGAKFALCSSTLVDADGFPYQDVFAAIKSDGATWNPSVAATSISKLYDKRYLKKHPDGSRFLFIVELNKTTKAVDCLNALGKKLADMIGSPAEDDPVRSAINAALIGAGANSTYVYSLRFARLLEISLDGRVSSALQGEVAKLCSELRQAVAGSFVTSPEAKPNPRVSPMVWAPLNAGTYDRMVKNYNGLESSAKGANGWSTLWRTYHNRPEDDGAPIANPAGEDTIGLPQA
jgi:hypothetical protein